MTLPSDQLITCLWDKTEFVIAKKLLWAVQEYYAKATVGDAVIETRITPVDRTGPYLVKVSCREICHTCRAKDIIRALYFADNFQIAILKTTRTLGYPMEDALVTCDR